MNAVVSIAGAICCFGKGEDSQFLSVLDMSVLPPQVASHISGVISDWEAVEGTTREAILANVRDRHHQARVVMNIETCMCGVSVELQQELLQEVEDLLKTLNEHDRVVANLLRAPLTDVSRVAVLAKQCLAWGLAATAGIVDRVRDSQQLLCRVVNQWLSIQDGVFSNSRGGRQSIWNLAVEYGVVLRTLVAPNLHDVEQTWSRLVFVSKLPADRMVIARVAKEIAHRLFPGQGHMTLPAIAPVDIPEDDWKRPPHTHAEGRRARESFERAIKQVNAIADAVSAGHDAQAQGFLNDLIADQTAYSRGEEHVVKSLCNIAQQCAEMYRTDFEYKCLETAIGIRPGDGWTLIQLADHYKRAGRYDDAIKLIRDAQSCGDARIAKSCLADVYAEMGRFDEAEALYLEIPGWELDPTIRGAQADTLRRRGQLEAATLAYKGIIADGLASDRVYAGLAEIAKRQDRLDDATKAYQDLLKDGFMDARSSAIYRMALAGVLVRKGAHAEAYRHLDAAVQARPFLRQARVVRAAVAGLLGNATKAIRDLPQLGQTRAFHEWVNDYVRGLVLLLLDQYADARVALLQEVQESLLDNNATGIRQMGAAVCFLRTKDGVKDAQNLLARVPDMGDAFADSIRMALQYHVAVSLNQATRMHDLKVRLSTVTDEGLRTLVTDIERRDWRKAWRLEVRTLLRLAA